MSNCFKCPSRPHDCDPKMLVSLLVMSDHANPNRRGVPHATEDDPARVRWIDELMKRRKR